MKEVEYVLRQGDVYIYKVDELPEGEQSQDQLTKNHQLALGELTHHNHYFADPTALDMFKVVGPKYEGLTFLDVKKPATLIHGLERGYTGPTPDNDFHSEITIPEGKYVTGIVVETDWLAKTMRKVID